MIQGLLKDVSEQEWQLAAGDKEDEDLGEVNGAKEDDKETIYMYWRLTWLAGPTNNNEKPHANYLSMPMAIWQRTCTKWDSVKSISKINNFVANCNEVLGILDKLEEQRTLYIQENNFRNILKKHILKLLKFKQEYWKKRYTVRWTKFGDENTKFFHAAATERFRQNTITRLETEDGRVIHEHFHKAAILFENFKGRMGQTAEPQMHYNLDDLFSTQEGLEFLSALFTREEIDNVVKQMPIDKAPGPDGFNGMFFKKCWHIIKEDIY